MPLDENRLTWPEIVIVLYLPTLAGALGAMHVLSEPVVASVITSCVTYTMAVMRRGAGAGLRTGLTDAPTTRAIDRSTDVTQRLPRVSEPGAPPRAPR